MPIAFERERDEHRVLAADAIGHPAEERACHAVEHAIDRQREGERRQREAEKADRHVGDLEILRDRRELRRGHQSARRHQHEHHVHHPERRRAHHLQRACDRAMAGRPLCAVRGASVEAARAPAATSRARNTTRPWARPNSRKVGFVAAGLDHVRDRNDGQRRAGAESHRGQPGRQSAAIRKPLERVADAGAVHGAGADAADCRGEVEQRQRVGDRVDHPGDADQDASAATRSARPEASTR